MANWLAYSTLHRQLFANLWGDCRDWLHHYQQNNCLFIYWWMMDDEEQDFGVSYGSCGTQGTIAADFAVLCVWLRYFEVTSLSRQLIDWLGLSLRWHVAYIEAASPDLQPHDDILHKDAVSHSSRALSHPSNTMPLKKQTENKWKTEDRGETMPCPEVLPNNHSPAHAIGGINHMPIHTLDSQLCWRLQLSELPVNQPWIGDTQSWWIAIGILVEHID